MSGGLRDILGGKMLGRVHRDVKCKQVREQRKEVLAELKGKSQDGRTEGDGGLE